MKVGFTLKKELKEPILKEIKDGNFSGANESISLIIILERFGLIPGNQAISLSNLFLGLTRLFRASSALSEPNIKEQSSKQEIIRNKVINTFIKKSF